MVFLSETITLLNLPHYHVRLKRQVKLQYDGHFKTLSIKITTRTSAVLVGSKLLLYIMLASL